MIQVRPRLYSADIHDLFIHLTLIEISYVSMRIEQIANAMLIIIFTMSVAARYRYTANLHLQRKERFLRKANLSEVFCSLSTKL